MSISDSNKPYLYTAVNNELRDKLKPKEYFSEECTDPVPRIGYRHLQVFLYFLLCFIAFGFRISLSVGIVAMTDPATSRNPDIPTYPEWDDKNLILSAFFWGYVIPQIFAGWAATKFGAKWFLIVTFGIQTFLGIFTPYAAANYGSMGVMIIRAIQGFCQGFIYPSLTHLLSQWAPAEERSVLGTIVFGAGPCGTVLAMFITGFISASWYGWPMVFYFYGILGFVWCITMMIFGYDSPAQHPRIGEAEKFYIENSLGHTDEKANHPTPWKAIFTSLPVWALFITQIGHMYCFWTLLIEIPSYMSYVMNFNIKDNSLLSSLPYLTLWLLSFVVGITSDLVINKGILTRTTSRKLFNSIGLIIPALSLVILGYTRADQPIQAVILLIVAVGSNAATYSGWCVNHIDLSPNHAGTLMGLCNGASQITGAVAPLVVQLLVSNETDQLQWRRVFLLAAGINIITSSFFAIFGSGKVQPWNDSEENEEEIENKA